MRLAVLLAAGCSSSALPAAPQRARDAGADAAIDAGARDDVVIAAVGDLVLGTTPLAGVPVSAADITFGNLEGPLLDGPAMPVCTPEAIAEKHHGKPGKDCFSFRMPERTATALRDAGFDVVSIANNHIDDFGPAGRARTIELLDAAHVAWSGPTGTIAHLHVRGIAIDVIAFATYAGLNDVDDLEAARALVAKSTADVVVVSFHGGAEGAAAQHVPDGPETYYGDRRGSVKAFAHAVVDAGADVVVGHGPHVIRGLERYRDRVIAYSLGTFASKGINTSGVAGATMVLEVTLDATGGLRGGRIVAARQQAGPQPDPRGEAIRLARELSNQDFGEHALRIADDGSF